MFVINGAADNIQGQSALPSAVEALMVKTSKYGYALHQCIICHKPPVPF